MDAIYIKSACIKVLQRALFLVDHFFVIASIIIKYSKMYDLLSWFNVSVNLSVVFWESAMLLYPMIHNTHLASISTGFILLSEIFNMDSQFFTFLCNLKRGAEYKSSNMMNVPSEIIHACNIYAIRRCKNSACTHKKGSNRKYLNPPDKKNCFKLKVSFVKVT